MNEKCNAGIAGGCGACEKCDPEFWLKLASEEIATLKAALRHILHFGHYQGCSSLAGRDCDCPYGIAKRAIMQHES